MRALAREAVVSLRATALIILLGCAFYPLAVFGVGQLFFAHQASGSLVDRDGNPATPDSAVGSRLLGQAFKAPQYFHPRPSAAGNGYDAANSSATNLGPLSEKLLNGAVDDPATKDVDESFAGIQQLVAAYRLENGLGEDVPVPADAVTRSASGLDPDITPANAFYQVARIARARGVSEGEVRKLVEQQTEHPTWGLFGDPRVNVLRVNLALDRQHAE
jgi:K+-transporting ATPase ATPase C chain